MTNTQARFIVFTALMLIGLPYTLLMLGISWLGDLGIISDYKSSYRKAWKQ